MNENRPSTGAPNSIIVSASGIEAPDVTHDGDSTDPLADKYPWFEPLVVVIGFVVIALIIVLL